MNAISKHFEKKTHKMFYECIKIVYDRDTERTFMNVLKLFMYETL